MGKNALTKLADLLKSMPETRKAACRRGLLFCLQSLAHPPHVLSAVNAGGNAEATFALRREGVAGQACPKTEKNIGEEPPGRPDVRVKRRGGQGGWRAARQLKPVKAHPHV